MRLKLMSVLESVAFADLEDVFAFAHRRALEGGGRSARAANNNLSGNSAASSVSSGGGASGTRQPTAASVLQLPLPEVSTHEVDTFFQCFGFVFLLFFFFF